MTQILDIAQVGVTVADRIRWEEFARDVLRLNDAMHQPVIFPAGTPVDIWGGDVQSPEFTIG